METIIRNISDLPETERSAAEQLVGHALASDQQLVIVVQRREGRAVNSDTVTIPGLPDWCHVYAGLSDTDIADIESTMLRRAELSRAVE